MDATRARPATGGIEAAEAMVARAAAAVQAARAECDAAEAELAAHRAAEERAQRREREVWSKRSVPRPSSCCCQCSRKGREADNRARKEPSGEREDGGPGRALGP